MHNPLKWPLVGAAIFSALAAFYALLIEPALVQLDRFTLEIDKPGLPPEGITILHLSDLHCRAGGLVQGLKLARLQRLLADAEYDLVALTGDLIDKTEGLPAVLALADGLEPRWGTFSCPGNRDYWESSLSAVFRGLSPEKGRWEWRDIIAVLRRLWDFSRTIARNERTGLQVKSNNVAAMNAALSAHGVQPLVNRSVRIQADKLDLWIAGVDDLKQGTPDLNSAIAGVPANALLLLLAHNPDVWLDARVQRADLVLSGHTHGGQLRLPLAGAIYTQATHLTRRRPAGWFYRESTHMFVSRGLGESLPVRFGARPQAALIHLVRTGT